MGRVAPLILIFVLLALVGWAQTPDVPLPALGRDSVLVWRILSAEVESNFVVRIAEFYPNRYFEWENSTSQGTVFLPDRSIRDARAYLNSRLFEAGVDTRGENATTLWLSKRVFLSLKEKKSAKLRIDSLDAHWTLVGTDRMTVEVNRKPAELPVIKVTDKQGVTRWFLDSEDNPLLAKHEVRFFSQTLSSITTDRPNSLRWIKGKKLRNHP